MGKKHTSNKVIVETILATGMSHKDAAALFSVSTRWIRELIHRYRKGGYQALEPRSRRPHSNPRQVPESTVKTILDIRQHLENTGQDNGAHTIRWHLQQQKITPLPAASTIHRILKRHGWVIEQPHKRPRSSWKRFQADQPNEMRLPSFSGHPICTDLVSVGEDVHCESTAQEVHAGVPA